MSFSKRKILVLDSSDEDDSFKRRRSSLKVNLSYSDNLSDSGNGSLRRTETETSERRTNTVQINRKLSRKKRNDVYNKNHQLDSNNEEDLQIKNDTDKLINKDTDISFHSGKGIRLKHLTVNLEDIRIKERTLEANCKHLKDAILNKTKEIYNKENELSKKTAMILQNEENCFADNTNVGNKSIILDTMTNQLEENKAVMECSNIVVTPTNSNNRLERSKRGVDKFRLTQRRLFTEEDKQVGGQAKCRIVEDIVFKKKFPLFSLRQIEQSPILSGSNRRLSLRRTQLCTENQSENHNISFSTIRSTDIGLPIVCSTFNEDIVTDKNESNSPCDKVDSDTSRVMRTTNKVISMEMTEICGDIGRNEKDLSVSNTNLNTSNSIENSKKKESKGKSFEQNRCIAQMQRMDINSLVDRSITQNTVMPMQISDSEEMIVKTRPHIHGCDNKIKNHERQRILSLFDSDNTIRSSSINVNTSLDAIIEANKEENIRNTKNYKFNNSSQSFKTTETSNEESTALDDRYESSNITEASMKMNTSINSMDKTLQRRSNHFQSLISDKNDDTRENCSNMDNQHSSLAPENEETNNMDFLENISLIRRLRNISTQSQVAYNNKLRVSKMKEKVKMDNKSNNTKLQTSEHTNGDSYVDGTPYPISRSVLFKTLLKHKTQSIENNLNSTKESIDNTKDKSDASCSEAIEIDIVISEDTSDNNPVIQDHLRVIEEKAYDIKLETNEKNTIANDNMKCTSVRKGRRKLLPLNENSQLCSITPIEDKCAVQEESTSTKTNKKSKKKKEKKKKSVGFKDDTSSVKRNIVKGKTQSDNDYGTSKNKKKKDKKVTKPRKIVSKKIVIKKFADENMMNMLNENRQNIENVSLENRKSLDDFVKHRTIHTYWNRYNSHKKIIIAMTGLSKGDKSLVKSIVKSLGMAEIESSVSRRTTHVVSTGVRTVNLLRGIIRGCWLVNLEWVLKSLENNDWLDPEEFEMKHFSKSVQENRKDRQLFGPSYIPELFATCGLIYVGNKTTIPCNTLKELVKIAGGHITENIKLAKIIIDSKGLKETWVIDSITTGELQLVTLYERK